MHESTHETSSPDPAPAPVSDEVDEPDEAAPKDELLDGFQSDLDTVASALDALDADDLDTAEALAAGLDEEE
ncbi:MAG: hypothetical protein R8F63_16265 [Acidimicrobiales bacterium]|nr:hypothetical protein [Acidimicrobiales bacterium]